MMHRRVRTTARPRRRAAITAALFLAAVRTGTPGPLGAQAATARGAGPDPGAGAPESAFCFRGRPIAQCRTFALGELGYAAALGWRDLAAVTLSADLVGAAGRRRGAVYAGVRLGSYPAVAATGLLAAGLAVFLRGVQD